MSFKNIFAGSVIGLGSLALTVYTATEFSPKISVYTVTNKVTKESVEVKLRGNTAPPLIPGTTTDLKFVVPAKTPWFLCLLNSLGYCAAVSLLSLGILKEQEEYR